VNEIGEHVACMMDRRGAYGFLVGKPKVKVPLEKQGTDGQDMDLQEIGCSVCVCVCVDWTNLAQDRERWLAVVKVHMNFQVPQNARSFMIS
jgi:hypothetical protein